MSRHFALTASRVFPAGYHELDARADRPYVLTHITIACRAGMPVVGRYYRGGSRRKGRHASALWAAESLTQLRCGYTPTVTWLPSIGMANRRHLFTLAAPCPTTPYTITMPVSHLVSVTAVVHIDSHEAVRDVIVSVVWSGYTT